ncbi:GNAT family N-acetyltransferase [Solirhodobacter olei]|uniref:GNAT family N-acetyltransferase n=1 Tax=Solirhodobacter olei TaxID=2493082 RepID=UPI000FDABAE1|nr:GNAT family N-acetyltransferase [Solirhodobacter olei]
MTEALLEIRPDDPTAPEVAPLLARHLQLMVDTSPPESMHALDASGLARPEVRFFTLREGGTILGMGALKQLSGPQGELKSMHILSEARGRGLARLLLDHLIGLARASGWQRLNLETGVEPEFEAARALYARAGFVACPPFEGYTLDPNSAFFTLDLT